MEDGAGASDRFAASDGTRLAYRRSGSGPPLVLVHGTASDGGRWRPILPFLEPTFSVFAFDRRGYGESGEAAGYAIADEFDDIACLVEAIGLGPAHLIGHSFGALCVLGAACRAGVAKGVVLYEPPLPARPEAYFPRDLIPAMREAMTRRDPDAAAAAFLSQVFAMGSEEILAFRRSAPWTRFRERAPNILRELEAVHALERAPDAFAACEAPALIVVGGESGPQYRETAALLHRVLPSSRVAVLEGQGHGAIDAAPALFASEAIAFLTGERLKGTEAPADPAFSRS